MCFSSTKGPLRWVSLAKRPGRRWRKKSPTFSPKEAIRQGALLWKARNLPVFLRAFGGSYAVEVFGGVLLETGMDWWYRWCIRRWEYVYLLSFLKYVIYMLKCIICFIMLNPLFKYAFYQENMFWCSMCGFGESSNLKCEAVHGKRWMIIMLYFTLNLLCSYISCGYMFSTSIGRWQAWRDTTWLVLLLGLFFHLCRFNLEANCCNCATGADKQVEFNFGMEFQPESKCRL